MIRKPLEKTLSLTALCSKMGKVSIRQNSSLGPSTNGAKVAFKAQITSDGIPPLLNSCQLPVNIWPTSCGGSLIGSRFPFDITMPVPSGRPVIGIINNKISPSYKDPFKKSEAEIEDPMLPFVSIIDTPLSENNKVEKQAAKLIVIRRIKMNKHKLRKLRKRMRFKWAKVKHRRGVRKEKAFLDAKLSQLKEWEKFDAQTFVKDCIQRAKEVPVPLRWQDPLMPAWYKEEEMLKEEKLNRYKQAVNLYLNRQIEFKPPPISRYVGEKKKITKK